MKQAPRFCGSCGKELTAEEQAAAVRADLPFCPKCSKEVAAAIKARLEL